MTKLIAVFASLRTRLKRTYSKLHGIENSNHNEILLYKNTQHGYAALGINFTKSSDKGNKVRHNSLNNKQYLNTNYLT